MMRKKYMPRALGPLLLVVLSPAVAQQNDDNEIIVSASRSNRTVAEMAQTTWVIENAELEQQIQGGKELKDALAQLIPGLDVSSQSRTNYGMNMRGRPLVVLIDGVRLNSSRSDSRQLDSVDPFNIDHIEVISGATALYGGGSTGGLINIVTKKGQPETMMEFEAGTKVALTAVKITMSALPVLSPAEMTISPDVFPWHIRNLAAGLTVTAMPPCLITPRPACSTPIGWTSWEPVR